MMLPSIEKEGGSPAKRLRLKICLAKTDLAGVFLVMEQKYLIGVTTRIAHVDLTESVNSSRLRF